MTAWKRASACKADSPMCVEVLPLAGGVAVRDSKDPDGNYLTFSHAEWATFCDAMRRGEFDLT